MISFLYLFLAVTLILNPSFTFAKWLDCNIPKSVIYQVDLKNSETAFVYDFNVKVKYNRDDFMIYDCPDCKTAYIIIRNATIDFSGRIDIGNINSNHSTPKTYRSLNTEISGSTQKTKNDYKDEITDCNLFLLRESSEENSNITINLQLEIIYKVASCVKSLICNKLNTTVSNDVEKSKDDLAKFGSLSVSELNGNVHDVNSKNSLLNENLTINTTDVKSLLSISNQSNLEKIILSNTLQSFLNTITDLGIITVINKLREENQGIIPLPDVHETYSWWKIKTEFDAYDGTFRDLTTLSRNENVTLSRDNLKFVISSGFRLSVANIQYNHYKLKSGLIKVDGSLAADINGGAVSISVGIDYNQKPCHIVLEELHITEMGDLKLRITGLGVLSKFLSNLIAWITMKWKNEIAHKIEDELKNIITKSMNSFKCEKYRMITETNQLNTYLKKNFTTDLLTFN